jgi:hypothetical protein
VHELWKDFLMRTPPWRTLFGVSLLAVAIACRPTTIVNNLPNDPSPAVVTAVVVKHTIQFRVNGNATSVRVRYSTPIDGLGQVVTSLPYFNTLVVAGDSLFLSLEGTPISYGFAVFYPFFSVQIVVDNNVFREATTQDFLLAPLSISGQWRQ